MRASLLLVLLIVPGIMAYSQDARSILIKMGERYREAKSFSMQLNMKVYEERFDEKAAVSFEGMVKKKGSNYYSEIMNKISLFNERCALIVDEGQQLIIVSKAVKDKHDAIAVIIDSVLFKNNKVKLKSDKGGKTVIEVFPAGGMYESVEVTLNNPDHALEKVVYNYKEGLGLAYEKIEISYYQVKFNTAIPESFFSEKTFITKKNSGYAGVGTRSGYKVIDQSTIKYLRDE